MGHQQRNSATTNDDTETRANKARAPRSNDVDTRTHYHTNSRSGRRRRMPANTCGILSHPRNCPIPFPSPYPPTTTCPGGQRTAAAPLTNQLCAPSLLQSRRRWSEPSPPAPSPPLQWLRPWFPALPCVRDGCWPSSNQLQASRPPGGIPQRPRSSPSMRPNINFTISRTGSKPAGHCQVITSVRACVGLPFPEYPARHIKVFFE